KDKGFRVPGSGFRVRRVQGRGSKFWVPGSKFQVLSMPARHVLIVGVSTRAAAESAARAGFRVTSIDAFADLDQHPSVRALSMTRDFGRRFTPAAVARAAPAAARRSPGRLF